MSSDNGSRDRKFALWGFFILLAIGIAVLKVYTRYGPRQDSVYSYNRADADEGRDVRPIVRLSNADMLVDARQGAASSAAELEEWLSRDPMPESYDGGRIPDEMRRFFHDPSSGILRITDVDGVTVYHMSPATFARAELPADFVSEGLDIVYEFAGGVPSAIDIVAIADLSSLVASVREVSDFFPGGARTFSLSNGRAYLSNYAMCAYPSRDRLLTALASLNDPDTAELLNIWRESALAEHQMAPIQCEAFVPPFVEQDRSYRVNVYTPDAVPLPDTDYSRDVRSVDLINLAEMQEALAD